MHQVRSCRWLRPSTVVVWTERVASAEPVTSADHHTLVARLKIPFPADEADEADETPFRSQGIQLANLEQRRATSLTPGTR